MTSDGDRLDPSRSGALRRRLRVAPGDSRPKIRRSTATRRAVVLTGSLGMGHHIVTEVVATSLAGMGFLALPELSAEHSSSHKEESSFGPFTDLPFSIRASA